MYSQLRTFRRLAIACFSMEQIVDHIYSQNMRILYTTVCQVPSEHSSEPRDLGDLLAC